MQSYVDGNDVLLVPTGDTGALRAARTPLRSAIAAAAQARFEQGDPTTRAMIGRYLALTDRVLGRGGQSLPPT